MRRRTVLLALAAAVLLATLPANAPAASSVSVRATANAQLVSISVDPTSLDFGVVPAGNGKSAGPLTVTNNGTVPAKLLLDGTNASGPGTLILTSAFPLGADQYALGFSTPLVQVWLPRPAVSVAWPSDPTIPVDGSTQASVIWQMGTPTSYGPYTAYVSVMAWAP